MVEIIYYAHVDAACCAPFNVGNRIGYMFE